MHDEVYVEYGWYRIRQNFRGGKLSRLCTKHTIHWKTFAVHQAHTIMYCTQQMIQGENFRDWLKNRENRESFPPRKFCRIRYMIADHVCPCHYNAEHTHTHTHSNTHMHLHTSIWKWFQETRRVLGTSCGQCTPGLFTIICNYLYYKG